MNWLTVFLLAILLALLIYEVYMHVMVKRSAKVMPADAFREGMRKGQLIDVRDKETFDAGHILGARNIPYTMIKSSLTAIRKDMPVYLYDQSKSLSIRTANILRKNGYKTIFILKGGYSEWDGKIKKKNQ